ncbi:hypothetical protein H072_537 [Dactylellina haptotyla CBS 200.50]|uniref:Uncharacterized protein n=1 Tax=Dactylellina haptotyla (strain CBS 200.50) TaxID=1284197 RepID=S8AR70_DACHA|nr:hypothetical protein H072_537 [Dactylellina haptotyla CBS 200.50]
MSDKEQRVWKPMIDIPIDPQIRINELKAIVDNPNMYNDEIKLNIKAAIADLEAGTMPYRATIYQDGKAISLQEIDRSRPHWMEGGLACAGNTMYTGFHGGMIWLEVAMFAGGPSIFLQVLDDTGSDYLTLRLEDFGILQPFPDVLFPVSLITFNGIVNLYSFTVAARLWSQAGTYSIGDWFFERAVIQSAQPGGPRLSSSGLRQAYYRATCPLPSMATVFGTNKTNLVRALPAV